MLLWVAGQSYYITVVLERIGARSALTRIAAHAGKTREDCMFYYRTLSTLMILSVWFYTLGRPWPIPPLGLGCSSREFYSSLDSNCAPWHRPVIVMRSGISLPFCDCKSAVKGGLGESLFRLLRLPRFPSSCYPTTFPMFYDFEVHCYCRLSFVPQLVLLFVNIA